ncbi:MAG: NAD(P)(+) transhydrogenase (Re/Si-specific) subunit alpha, partial [Aridibacter sp.]
MLIGVPKELHPDEKRVSLVPNDVKKLVRLGADVRIEKGIGSNLGYSDTEYSESGAIISENRDELLQTSDIILRIRKPVPDEIQKLKTNAIHISFLDPFNETELIQEFQTNKITAISMEMIPRTTLAQKMDALSSQANLAGYVMVILACQKLPSILPMMMTPAGTLK